MESHYVYIIYSESHDKYYKGYSQQPEKRLIQHNLGESTYTKNFLPWKIVYLDEFSSKRDALIRERGLKKYSKIQIQDLIKLSKNILG